ncbi:retrotransposon protein, putative, ty1-copia subclass [Tanacetum coccineum]|uniref:Retrotransposon protein, putative, ty1-copia subclass n=1 Tax=Tanacetum coccineum TaxID=301880 RepID=A0ABQ5DZX5_9ASTR
MIPQSFSSLSICPCQNAIQFSTITGKIFNSLGTSSKKVARRRKRGVISGCVAPIDVETKKFELRNVARFCEKGFCQNVYRGGLENWVIGLLQPVIDDLKKPDYVERVEIKQFSLGDEPFVVRNVERKTSRSPNDLQYQIGLRYTGGARMLLMLTLKFGIIPIKVPVGVRDFDIDGELWVKTRRLDFPTTRCAIPVLSMFLRKLLTEDLPRLFVRPKKIVLDFQKGKAVGPLPNDFKSGETQEGNKDFAGELSHLMWMHHSGASIARWHHFGVDQVNFNCKISVVLVTPTPRHKNCQLPSEDTFSWFRTFDCSKSRIAKGSAGEILLRLTYKVYVEDEEDEKIEADIDTSDDEFSELGPAGTTYEPPSPVSDKETFMDVLAAFIVSEEFQGIVASEASYNATDMKSTTTSSGQTTNLLDPDNDSGDSVSPIGKVQSSDSVPIRCIAQFQFISRVLELARVLCWDGRFPNKWYQATFEYDGSNDRRHKSRSKIEVDGVFCLLGSASLEEARRTRDYLGSHCRSDYRMLGSWRNNWNITDWNFIQQRHSRALGAEVCCGEEYWKFWFWILFVSFNVVPSSRFGGSVMISKRNVTYLGQLDDEGGCVNDAVGKKEGLGGNLMEGVDWEAEWLNAISERLGERLYERLGERLHEGLCQRFCEQMFGTDGGVEAIGSIGTSGSSVDKFSVSVTHLVTSGKAKVIKWMFKGVKAFSHVNLDESVGFDEVLVAELDTAKINKPKRWVFSWKEFYNRSLVWFRCAFLRTEKMDVAAQNTNNTTIRKSLSLEPDKNKQCDQAICFMYMKRISREMYGAYAKSYECAVMGIHGLEPIMQPQVRDKEGLNGGYFQKLQFWQPSENIDREVKSPVESGKERKTPLMTEAGICLGCGIVSQLTLPYTPQHNGVFERRNQTLLDMVRSMMNLTTLPKSFWGYALESAARIRNMVPTKKVERTPYEIWHGKAPKLSYLRVWGCEELVKRDAPDKLDPRSIKCIFVGYPKETIGYYFYYLLENKIFVARNAEFFENNLMVQEASGSHRLLESSGSEGGLKLNQEEDTQPSKNTREIHDEVAPIEVEPQNVKVSIRILARIPQAPNRYGFYVDVEEYELRDLNEPPNYKAALSDPEFDKWLKAMNTEMQSMKDNQVWVLVDFPPDGRTVGISGSNVVFLILYVDDILLMENNVTMLQEVKSWLCKCFSMKNLRKAAYILGIKIIRNRSKRLIALSQSAYLEKNPKEILDEKNPRIGSIMYAIHWTAVKTILKYLRNTKDMVLVYGKKPKAELKVSCYADASLQTDKDDTKFQTGYVFILNSGALYWKSANQCTTAMSSTEAEYIAAAEASMEAVWMRTFIDGLGGVVPLNKRPMEMLCVTPRQGGNARHNEIGIITTHRCQQ